MREDFRETFSFFVGRKNNSPRLVSRAPPPVETDPTRLLPCSSRYGSPFWCHAGETLTLPRTFRVLLPFTPFGSAFSMRSPPWRSQVKAKAKARRTVRRQSSAPGGSATFPLSALVYCTPSCFGEGPTPTSAAPAREQSGLVGQHCTATDRSGRRTPTPAGGWMAFTPRRVDTCQRHADEATHAARVPGRCMEARERSPLAAEGAAHLATACRHALPERAERSAAGRRDALADPRRGIDDASRRLSWGMWMAETHGCHLPAPWRVMRPSAGPESIRGADHQGDGETSSRGGAARTSLPSDPTMCMYSARGATPPCLPAMPSRGTVWTDHL